MDAAPGSGGEYAVQVWVREVGSMAAYDAWAGAPFTLDRRGCSSSLVVPGDPVSEGRSVSLPLSGANPWTYSMSASAIEDEGSWCAGVRHPRGSQEWATGVFEADTATGHGPPRLYRGAHGLVVRER